MHSMRRNLVRDDEEGKPIFSRIINFILEFKENLRSRLLIDMGKLLGKSSQFCMTKERFHFSIDVLVENHSDDASSIKTALKVDR